MSYVGNIPAEKYSSLTQQTFSSPTGTNFVLSQSVTNNLGIVLIIDNVRQDPAGASYTAVGTSLVLSEAISSPSTMYCLFNGKTTETVSPPAGSVDSSHIVAGAVDDSHISGLSASKLTGSLPASMNEITKSSSEPTTTTNPSGGVGTVYLRTTTGEMYCCTDATTNANVWTNIGDGTGAQPTVTSATGGTITTDGDYKVHIFNSSGNFVVSVSDAGVEYLVIAGGGGAGADGSGGGGAGGYLTAAGLSVTNQTYAVTVGAGGANSSGNTAASGSNSVFSTITSTGGGSGGGTTGGTGTGVAGGNGGSGGGGTWAATAGGTGISGQGFAGGVGGPQANAHAAGGGGGASEVGAAGVLNNSGDGGDGLSSSITGSAIVRSGGGGGGNGTGSAYAGGDGGNGGGGNGYGNNHATANGTVNLGGGGGGANTGSGGTGGSGVVILRYKFQ